MSYYNLKSGTFVFSRAVSSLSLLQLRASGILPVVQSPAIAHDIYKERLVYGEMTHDDLSAWQSVTVEPRPEAELAAWFAKAKEDKRKLATAVRWAKETGGINDPVLGTVLTTLDDQNRIASALMGINATRAAGAPITEVDFKGTAGWTKVSAEQLTAVAAVVSHHVQACFSRECALHKAIDAAEDWDALNAVTITEGWPEHALGIWQGEVA